MINDKLKVIELFAGIGACHNALNRTGINFEIIDVVEFNKSAIHAYNAIHQTNWEAQNILEWNKNIKCDYLHASTPCQAFSVNGKGKGADDERGFPLWDATLRVIKQSEPKFITLENVRGLLSDKHKQLLNFYISELDKLGYKSNIIKINSKDYGIPQNRERVFIISILKNLAIAENRQHIQYIKSQKKLLKTLLEPDAVWQTFKVENFNPIYKYAYVKNCLGSYKGKAIEIDIFKEPKDWQISLSGILKSVTFDELLQSDLNIKNLKLDNIILTTEKITEITEKKVEDYVYKSNGAKYNNIEGLVPTLDTKASQKSIVDVSFNEDKNFKSIDGITGTITASSPNFKNKIMEIETENSETNATLIIKYRKLTNLELCRLMDFDDDDYKRMVDAKVSPAQMSILFGNSMVVACVYNVLSKIFNHFL